MKKLLLCALLTLLFAVVAPAQTTNTSFNFEVNGRGAASLSSVDSGQLTVGYGTVRPDATGTKLDGLAIFGFRQNGILVSEAAVPASTALSSGRIYAEVDGRVNTGLAIANPNTEAVTLNFYFTDAAGTNFGSGSMTIDASSQVARFLNEAPFNGGSFGRGTFTFSASKPVAITALRGFTNERSEFLITTLPVADLGLAASTGAVVFPHFAAGGGWTTEIALVNPSDSEIAGTAAFYDATGLPVTVQIDQQAATSFTYTIPARSSRRLKTVDQGTAVQVGSVRITPNAGQRTPTGLGIFAFHNAGITASEAGVPAIANSNAFRMYAEASGNFESGEIGSIQTGLAIANSAAAAVTVSVEVLSRTGQATGLTGSLAIPGSGQKAIFLRQIPGLTTLPVPYSGIIRLTTASGSISVVGLRGRYNERSDFLITTTTPADEASSATTTELYYPHFATGGGYTTQFVVFNRAGAVTSGSVRFTAQNGQTTGLPLTSVAAGCGVTAYTIGSTVSGNWSSADCKSPGGRNLLDPVFSPYDQYEFTLTAATRFKAQLTGPASRTLRIRRKSTGAFVGLMPSAPFSDPNAGTVELEYALEAGTYIAEVQAPDATASGTYTLSTSLDSDTTCRPTVFGTVGVTIQDSIDPSTSCANFGGYEEYLIVLLQTGDKLRITLTTTTFNPLLVWRDDRNGPASPTLVSRSANAPGTVTIDWTATFSGFHEIVVWKSGAAGAYTLSVERVP